MTEPYWQCFRKELFFFFAHVRFLFVMLSLPTLLILNFHLCEGKRMNSSPNAVKSSGILQFSLNKHINGILISHCRFQFRIHSPGMEFRKSLNWPLSSLTSLVFIALQILSGNLLFLIVYNTVSFRAQYTYRYVTGKKLFHHTSTFYGRWSGFWWSICQTQCDKIDLFRLP